MSFSYARPLALSPTHKLRETRPESRATYPSCVGFDWHISTSAADRRQPWVPLEHRLIIHRRAVEQEPLDGGAAGGVTAAMTATLRSLRPFSISRPSLPEQNISRCRS